MSGGRSQGIVRTTSMILVVVVISKVLGMAREMLLAGRLGNGPENSAYSVAFSLVYTLTLLFSCFLQTAFQPIYSRVRFQEGRAGADRYASAMLTFFGLAGLLVGVGLYAFAPAVAAVYMPGYSAAGQALVAQMIRLLTPMFVLQVAAYLLTAVLNANESFIVPHVATMSLSFALIPTLALSRSADPVRVAQAVAIATSASAVLEVAIQLPAAARRLRFRPLLAPRDPWLKQTLIVALPAVIATGSSEINQLLQKNLTSTIDESAASALVFGYKTYAIYVGLLILPITVILFSRLGRLAAANDRAGMLDTQRRCLEAMMLVLLPVVLLSMILHRDIIRILYQRDRFTAGDTLLTGSAFLMYLPGLLGYAVKDIFSRFFFSIQDTRTPMWVGVGALLCNMGLNFALVGRLGIAGLALASTLTLLASGAVLVVILRRKIGPLMLGAAIGQFARIALATALSGVVAYLGLRLAADRGVVARVLAAGLVPLVLYIFSVLLLRVDSARWLARETAAMFRKGGAR